MLTRLLILWLLAEQPLHGYRIKKILDDDVFGFWFPTEFASIYSVLRTLARRGFIRLAAVERQGQRPERTRYAITPKGRAELRALLRKAWTDLPSPGKPIHLALAARAELDDEEIQKLLGERIAALRDQLRRLDAKPHQVLASEMNELQRGLTSAELAWAESWLATRNKEQT